MAEIAFENGRSLKGSWP